MLCYVFTFLTLTGISGVIVMLTTPPFPSSLTSKEIAEHPNNDDQGNLIRYKMYHSQEFKQLMIGAGITIVSFLIMVTLMLYIKYKNKYKPTPMEPVSTVIP